MPLYLPSGLTIWYIFLCILSNLSVSNSFSNGLFLKLWFIFSIILGWVRMVWVSFLFRCFPTIIHCRTLRLVHIFTCRIFAWPQFPSTKNIWRGSPENVQVISAEIIDRELEILMNPLWLVSFGEHRLWDICNEEQKM